MYGVYVYMCVRAIERDSLDVSVKTCRTIRHTDTSIERTEYKERRAQCNEHRRANDLMATRGIVIVIFPQRGFLCDYLHITCKLTHGSCVIMLNK